MGVVPEIAPYRATLLRELPNFDVRAFDRLGDYALATAYAHTRRSRDRESSAQLRARAERGLVLRQLLWKDVRTLVGRGLLPAGRLENLTGAVGFKNIANDLEILTGLLAENWSSVEGKCATTSAEVREGSALVVEIVRVLGLREQAPAGAGTTADRRARAFALFVGSYEKVRRAMEFILGDREDIDALIPSLYAVRNASRKRKAAKGPSAAETPAASGVTAPNPTSPSASATADPADVAPKSKEANKVVEPNKEAAAA